MKLNVDLPDYKWKEILNYLKPHIDESENVANFCNAIEIGNYVQGNSLEQDIYSFLISNNLPPTYLPVSRTIAKGKGGLVFLKGFITNMVFLLGKLKNNTAITLQTTLN